METFYEIETTHLDIQFLSLNSNRYWSDPRNCFV